MPFASTQPSWRATGIESSTQRACRRKYTAATVIAGLQHVRFGSGADIVSPGIISLTCLKKGLGRWYKDRNSGACMGLWSPGSRRPGGRERSNSNRETTELRPQADELFHVRFGSLADIGTRPRDVGFGSKAEVLRHECKDEGRGSGAGAAENSFCVSSVHLVPHLGTSHCFIAKMTQLSTAPILLVLPSARGADLAHLERKNAGLANLWMSRLSAHFLAGNSTTTSV